jgi:heme/copper-type cytochrome/quinol oxidase subunit 1
MINRQSLRSPGVLFLALAICLFPLGLGSFHSDWPPLSWKHTHFSVGDIGQTILACSGLFFVFALAYFFFPRILHRRMIALLGQLHFWANVIAFLLLLVFPVYFNLTFRSTAGESKLDKFFRAFGASMDSDVWGILVLVIVQILFLGNLLWSIFRGEKLFRPAMIESSPTSKQA